jgi:xanthine dehydrogenase YagR molybdenum-binding subunit
MSRIGEPIARPDGADKVTGRARYAADFKALQMLHAAYVAAGIPAGRVRAVNPQRALQHPGVVRVLAASDMPTLKVEMSPPAASGFVPLQSHEVRHQGQPVAIVLAETQEAALHGARLVDVTYEPAEFLAPDLDPSRLPSRATPYNPATGYSLGEEWEFCKGDVEAGLAQATHQISAIYVQPSRHSNPMEPSATLAEWRGDELVLHDSVQHGYSVQAVLAGAFEIRPEQVRVICPHTGGGFGAKGYVWPHELLTAAAARVVGRPVRLVLTRADMYANVGYQPRILQQVSLGADGEGRLTALRQEVVNVTSVSEDFVEQCSMAGKSMYAVPALHTTQRVERSHVNLPTAMRAPVEGPGTWAIGSAMDELAHTLGIDPLDLRLLNYAETSPRDGRPWSSKRLREAYELGATRFGWRERRGRPRTDGHWRIGYGVADCIMGTFRMASKARVRLRSDGSAVVEAGFHDIGSGTLTVMPQIAADILRLPIENVSTVMGDTSLPQAGPTYGSSSTLSGGSAVHRAAEAVRSELARLANLPPERAVMRDGRIALAGNGPGQPIAMVMDEAGVPELVGEGEWVPGPGVFFDGDGGGGPYAMKTFGVVFVEVGVDPELGLLRLRRVVGAYSAGRIINPRTARAQMTGAMIWGWGMAAMEASRHETHLGRWEAKNLANVALPVNADIPSDALEVIFVDEFDEHASPLGAKGIGELGASGVAAAVANAVFDAVGKRVRSLPITPAALLEG